MIEWSAVAPGDVVKSVKDGRAWEVVEKRQDGKVTIRNGAKVFTIPVSGEVEVIATKDEMMAAATASVKIVMPGAVTISVQNSDGVWTCPNTYPDAGVLQSHAFVMHGKKLTETDLIDMLGQHRAWHDASDVHKPHIHTKDFWRDRS
jgi:hypothetical protein